MTNLFELRLFTSSLIVTSLTISGFFGINVDG
jgi:hypothetical protein